MQKNIVMSVLLMLFTAQLSACGNTQVYLSRESAGSIGSAVAGTDQDRFTVDADAGSGQEAVSGQETSKGREALTGSFQAGTADTAEVTVYLSGAVHSAGVYTLREGERLADAVAKAGGLTGEADEAAVNLAEKVTDGSHYHFPTVSENAAGSGAESGRTVTEDGRVDINHADTAGLMTLPGIGESKAKAIITYREEHGPFSDIEDLCKVSGIGEATVRNMKDGVTVR